jgi:hypothetical protein
LSVAAAWEAVGVPVVTIADVQLMIDAAFPDKKFNVLAATTELGALPDDPDPSFDVITIENVLATGAVPDTPDFEVLTEQGMRIRFVNIRDEVQ